MPDCLLSLVALTKGDNDCLPLPTGAPADYTATAEGLYLDRAEGLSLLGIPADKAFKLLNAARAIGVSELRSDLNRAFASRYTARASWQGGLGRTDFTESAQSGAPALLTLDTRHLEGQSLRLVSMILLTDQAVDNAQLLLDGAPVGPVFSGGGGALTPVGIDVTVPLDGLTHTLSVVLPPATRARLVKIACGGCGHARVLEPYLRNASAQSAGLSFQAQTVCSDDLLCTAVSFGGEARRSLAWGVFTKAVETFAIERITGTGANTNVNALNVDDWKFLADRYATKYRQWLDWLTTPEGGLRAEASPCYACKTAAGAPFLAKSYGQPR